MRLRKVILFRSPRRSDFSHRHARRACLRIRGLHSPLRSFTFAGVNSLPKPTRRQWLYLLALSQLVGGPLVLMQVMVFCRVTAREAPSQGLVKAVSVAWHSEEFQAQIIASNDQRTHQADSTFPPKKTVGNSKIQGIVSTALRAPSIVQSATMKWASWKTLWTSAWPQAPPCPPPRAV